MFSACLSLFMVFFFSSYPLFSYLRREGDAFSSIALNFVLSILIYYSLFLLIPDFRILGYIAFVITLFGMIRFGVDWRYRPHSKHSRPLEAYFVFIYLAGILANSIVNLPIGGWDASAIWFFASKIIYLSQGRGLGEAFTHPSLAVYFHMDYPKLYPALAAVLMSAQPVWDEYFPKLSICFLAFPALLWIISFYERKWSYLFLISLLFMNSEDFLWNGYLDAYVGVYFALTFLLIYRYIEGGKKTDLYSALACLAFISNLKNEGLVMGLCAALAAAGIYFRHLKARSGMVALTMLIPSLIWWIRKKQWGLHNYLNLSDNSYLRDRFFTFSSWKIIGNALFFENHPFRDSVIIFCVLILILHGCKISWRPLRSLISWLLLTNFIYLGVLFLVYLSTPFELRWHLATSVSRTTLPLTVAVNLGSYFLIKILAKSVSNKQKLSL